MNNKIKTFYPDKALRELAERLGIDKKTPEEIGQYRHYLSPSEDTLKEAMTKFTDWLDSQLLKTNVDQNGDHERISNRQ